MCQDCSKGCPVIAHVNGRYHRWNSIRPEERTQGLGWPAVIFDLYATMTSGMENCGYSIMEIDPA